MQVVGTILSGLLVFRHLHFRRPERKLPLYLATVEAIVEIYIVPAADPQITRYITIEMNARKIHAAHVRTVRENASEARSGTFLTIRGQWTDHRLSSRKRVASTWRILSRGCLGSN